MQAVKYGLRQHHTLRSEIVALFEGMRRLIAQEVRLQSEASIRGRAM